TADSQITQLSETVTNLQVQNDLFRAENDKMKQHYKELYYSIKITRAKHIEQVTTLTTKNVNLKAQILDKVNSVSRTDRPLVSRLRMLKTYDEGYSRLMNFVKKFIDTVRFKNDHFGAIMGYEDYVIGRTDRPLVSRLRMLKTYDEGYSRLMNFVKKFIDTVRFKNDHFGAIMGYEDYVIGNSVISRVYYMEGLGHNLFSVRQFCDSDLEVAFKNHSCYVRDTDGPAPNLLTSGQISSGLVPNSVPATPYVPPTNKDLENLFQPMFDEYLEPPHAERLISHAPIVQAPVNSAGTPSSTTIDQDAPSPSISLSSSALQS
nr:integrase, catalytic region, zinc finger, CCHC-type, peptidase aspartic, catalytic [Tanacetum cinerariifolium]